MGYPSRREAGAMLRWAGEQNPGRWVDHSMNAARVAETVASAAGLDADKAYALGLLHDVGRFEGVRDLHHVIAGYELMTGKGYDVSARICLTHSFPYKHLGAYSGKNFDCSERELAQIERFLERAEYDDYDKLIQLCDAMSLPSGVTIVDARLMDVAMRHGFNDYTIRKWQSIFDIKSHFDGLCHGNIYALFREEIEESVFHTDL